MTPETTSNDKPQLNMMALELKCDLYRKFRAEEKAAKENADVLKPFIMEAVHQFGAVPENAPKSRRIEGKNFVITVTTGGGVEIDDQKACELELLMAKARVGSKFPLLFERRSEYSLAKTAAVTIQHEKWPKRFAEEIVNLFGRCFTPKTSTPSLIVDTREAAEAREKKEAEKAVKAAAKEAKAAQKAGR